MVDESLNLQFSFTNKDYEDISVYVVDGEYTLVLNHDRPSKSYYIHDWDDVYGEYVKLFDSLRYMNSADPIVLETIDLIEESEATPPDKGWDKVRELVKEVL